VLSNALVFLANIFSPWLLFRSPPSGHSSSLLSAKLVQAETRGAGVHGRKPTAGRSSVWRVETILGTCASFVGKEGEEGFICHSFLAMDIPLEGCLGALGGNPFFSC